MRLGDLDALKEALDKVQYTQEFCVEHQIDYSISMQMLGMTIDNAPTVNDCPKCEYKKEYDYISSSSSYKELQALRKFKRDNERTQGKWIEFAQWVAKEVLDNYFEDCSGAFAEIACRKLVKLGLVELEDNVYKMKGGAK